MMQQMLLGISSGGIQESNEYFYMPLNESSGSRTSFGNYASSPYEPNLSYNIPILSYIGDPPDGGISYYPESAGFKLRTRCRGKVIIYQWPKASYP